MYRLIFLALLAFATAVPSPALAVTAPVKCTWKNATFGTSFDCVKQLAAGSGVSTVNTNNPVQIVLGILRVVLTLVAIAGVIALIIAGAMYMFAAGDPSKADKAKKAILYVVIGLFIIGASILIVNLIIRGFSGNAGQAPPPGGPKPPAPPP